MIQDAADRAIRSILLVPASNPAMIAKAAAAQADAICIDCEDAVAPDQKPAARQQAIDSINALDFRGKTVMVRINALDGPFAYQDVIALATEAAGKLDLLVVPKVEGRDDLRFVDMLLTQIETATGGRPIAIEALIETAAGLVEIREIAKASKRLEALIFGSGDFAASMQMPQMTIGGFDDHDAFYPGHRWHHAMSSIVAAARANGLRAIDGPFAGVRDAEGLERASHIARTLGFDGKWCIHPSQPATVDRIFSPSADEIAQAQAVMAGYHAALREGRGAVSVSGKMIDAASLRACRALLRKAGLPAIA
nr:CoA ester lyase [Sphingomonas sp. Y57]